MEHGRGHFVTVESRKERGKNAIVQLVLKTGQGVEKAKQNMLCFLYDLY